MTIHLPGLPHTITDAAHSHCAFTGKILRFGPMMVRQGYEVIHYGNGGSPDGGVKHVSILTEGELSRLIGPRTKDQYYGDLVNAESQLYKLFNAILSKALVDHVKPGDIICFPFGSAHKEAVQTDAARQAFWLESGIGYEDRFCDFRVFESYAWLHWHHGKYQYPGSDYEWVAPNYFDVYEWEPDYGPGDYVLFFGRICDVKGMEVVRSIARVRTDLRFVICGQGDPKPYLNEPNIEYHPPVHGEARSDIMRKAIAVLCPTRYIEPFGGVAIEAMLCGRPVLASHFGAFSETLPDSLKFDLHTLGDWLEALKRVEGFDDDKRRHLRRYAVDRFGMVAVGKIYDTIFKQIGQLSGEGWNTRTSLRVNNRSITKSL